jgi:hypothetical protein
MLHPYKPLLIAVDASSAELLLALEKLLRIAGPTLSNGELTEALALRLQVMLAQHRIERAHAAP